MKVNSLGNLLDLSREIIKESIYYDVTHNFISEKFKERNYNIKENYLNFLIDVHTLMYESYEEQVSSGELIHDLFFSKSFFDVPKSLMTGYVKAKGNTQEFKLLKNSPCDGFFSNFAKLKIESNSNLFSIEPIIIDNKHTVNFYPQRFYKFSNNDNLSTLHTWGILKINNKPNNPILLLFMGPIAIYKKIKNHINEFEIIPSLLEYGYLFPLTQLGVDLDLKFHQQLLNMIKIVFNIYNTNKIFTYNSLNKIKII